MSNDNHLVLSALGEDRPGIVKALTKCCADHDCSILDSRMTVLGGEFAVLMMATGSWDNIARLEKDVTRVAKTLDLLIHTKQTKKRDPDRTMAYSVSVVALDHPGIVNEIAAFFASRQISIADLHTATYCAPHTGSQMFSLDMLVKLPADTHLASMREEFMMFCDDRNLDAAIEPQRNL